MPEISFFHKITSENYFIYFTNIVSLIPKKGQHTKRKKKDHFIRNRNAKI